MAQEKSPRKRSKKIVEAEGVGETYQIPDALDIGDDVGVALDHRLGQTGRTGSVQYLALVFWLDLHFRRGSAGSDQLREAPVVPLEDGGADRGPSVLVARKGIDKESVGKFQKFLGE